MPRVYCCASNFGLHVQLNEYSLHGNYKAVIDLQGVNV